MGLSSLKRIPNNKESHYLLGNGVYANSQNLACFLTNNYLFIRACIEEDVDLGCFDNFSMDLGIGRTGPVKLIIRRIMFSS